MKLYFWLTGNSKYFNVYFKRNCKPFILFYCSIDSQKIKSMVSTVLERRLYK